MAIDPATRANLELTRTLGGERRDERDLEQAHVVLGFPSIGYHRPDHHAFQVFSTLFGGGSASAAAAPRAAARTTSRTGTSARRQTPPRRIQGSLRSRGGVVRARSPRRLRGSADMCRA